MKARHYCPWRGASYDKGLRGGLKLLVVGDSHYSDDEKEASDPSLTCRIVDQAREEAGWRFFEHIRRTACGVEKPLSQNQFWQSVAFVNLVQDALMTSSSLPSAEQIERGWRALRETVAELSPDLMFVFSARAWDHDGPASRSIETDGNAFVSYGQLYGIGCFPRAGRKPLWSARFNHPRQPGCEASVWRVWAEKAWQLAMLES